MGLIGNPEALQRSMDPMREAFAKAANESVDLIRQMRSRLGLCSANR
jgi:hypothetical protein